MLGSSSMQKCRILFDFSKSCSLKKLHMYRVYKKKVIEFQRAIVQYVNYSSYEQMFFISGKIRLLTILNDMFFMPSGEKIGKYESDKQC
jgi:hypothetical protein